MSDEHSATLLLSILGVILVVVGASLSVVLGRNTKLHFMILMLLGPAALFCFWRAVDIYRKSDAASVVTKLDQPSPIIVKSTVPRLKPIEQTASSSDETPLALSVNGESWHRAEGTDLSRYAGDWCHPLGVTQLRFSQEKSSYRFDLDDGNGWQQIKVWRSNDRIRIELPDHAVIFFLPTDTPDYIREVFRKQDGLGQIFVSGDYENWNCNRCLMDDAGRLTWCKGDPEYDKITAERRARGASNLPPKQRPIVTDASVILRDLQ